VPRFDLPLGSKIRVHIKARNVTIALQAPAQTSFRNILPARVEEVSDENGSLVDVRLNIGSRLLAKITPSAKQSLDLKPGRQVFALIKSVAVLTGNLSLEEQ
jgi:molybdate transport system ATP-binding protein